MRVFKILILLSTSGPEYIIESEACPEPMLRITIRPGMHQLIDESAVEEEEFLRNMHIKV